MKLIHEQIKFYKLTDEITNLTIAHPTKVIDKVINVIKSGEVLSKISFNVIDEDTKHLFITIDGENYLVKKGLFKYIQGLILSYPLLGNEIITYLEQAKEEENSENVAFSILKVSEENIDYPITQIKDEEMFQLLLQNWNKPDFKIKKLLSVDRIDSGRTRINTFILINGILYTSSFSDKTKSLINFLIDSSNDTAIKDEERYKNISTYIAATSLEEVQNMFSSPSNLIN